MDSKASGRATVLLASLMVIGGLAALTFGAQWVVDGTVAIAENLGVSDEIIGLAVVAAGTSLPELATSTAAALRHKPGIAVGNIVGSNIFNIFFILGVSAVINPLTLGPQSNLSILAVIISSLVLLGFMLRGKPEHFLDIRKEGIAFLTLYAGYSSLTGLVEIASSVNQKEPADVKRAFSFGQLVQKLSEDIFYHVCSP